VFGGGRHAVLIVRKEPPSCTFSLEKAGNTPNSYIQVCGCHKANLEK
jgi:hypothetical protein